GRRLDPPVALDDDVPDGRDDLGRLLGRLSGLGLLRRGNAQETQESDQRRETYPPPRRRPPSQAAPEGSQKDSSGERGPGGQRSARLSVGSETGSKMRPPPRPRSPIGTPS